MSGGVLSLEESKLYYYGLPSQPRLVARTTTTPWEYGTEKELRPIGNHHQKLKKAWQNDLPNQLFNLLNELKVEWTSFDIIRIARVGDTDAPAILWLGVMPESLSGEKGVEVAVKCKKLLLEHGISDVDCEIRESKVSRNTKVSKNVGASTTCCQPLHDVGDPSLEESKFYYYGLPSQPRLVARTTTTPWEYGTEKELRAIGNHHQKLKKAWQNDLPNQLFNLLDELKVEWTSIDMIRIACVGDIDAPAILWLGVMPESLSGEKGVEVAIKCKKLLLERGILDVDCEIRESKIIRNAEVSRNTGASTLCCQPLHNIGKEFAGQSLTLTSISSPPSSPRVPSFEESTLYYYGLPSQPRLVARTTTTPWEYGTAKELRPIGDHKNLKKVWQDNFPKQLFGLLSDLKVEWTSIDIIRIARVGDIDAPAILWLGVMPKSLSCEKGVEVAVKCKKLLLEHGISDVDCEIREAKILRNAGPKLLESVRKSDPTANIRIPLTTTLGQPISTLATPSTEGTLGFLIQEGGNRSKLFGVTAAHVVSNRGKDDSMIYHRQHTSQPAQKVTLLGNRSYSQLLNRIKEEITGQRTLIDLQERTIKTLQGKESNKAKAERTDAQNELDDATKTLETLQNFEQEVQAKWGEPKNRVLGFTLLSPPIVAGAAPDGYTQDWAIIELDLDKFDADNFEGNAIDLGTDISPQDFTTMMHPNLCNRSIFQYPVNRLLKLHGKISFEEMRAPTSLDENGEPCLMVIKRGRTTGLTIGRASELESFSRDIWGDGTTQISKEWAILPRNSKSGAFSAKGDSGAAIVDGEGRLGGMLNGGSSFSETSDVSYASPIHSLLDSFKRHGFGKANLSPELPVSDTVQQPPT